jgi:hypothetical protein
MDVVVATMDGSRCRRVMREMLAQRLRLLQFQLVFVYVNTLLRRNRKFSCSLSVTSPESVSRSLLLQLGILTVSWISQPSTSVRPSVDSDDDPVC